jgi:hypothetical protein
MIFETYGYFFVTLGFLLFWIISFLFRKDLRHKLLKVSLYGALLGVFADFWFTQDYWCRPTLFGWKFLTLDDILFGFTIVGVSVVIYDVFFRTMSSKKRIYQRDKKGLITIFSGCIVIMLVFGTWLGFQSMEVGSVAFILAVILILYRRKDLVKPCLLSGLLTLLLSLVLYLFYFNIIAPNYWYEYCICDRTLFVFNFPIHEPIWYLTWGMVGGVLYEFTSGREKVKAEKWKSTKSL